MNDQELQKLMTDVAAQIYIREQTQRRQHERHESPEDTAASACDAAWSFVNVLKGRLSE